MCNLQKVFYLCSALLSRHRACSVANCNLPFTWKVVPFCLPRYSWNNAQSGHLYKAVNSNLRLLREKGQAWSVPFLCCNASNGMPWITTSVTLCLPMASNFIRPVCRTGTTSHNCRFRGSLALCDRSVTPCKLHATEGLQGDLVGVGVLVCSFCCFHLQYSASGNIRTRRGKQLIEITVVRLFCCSA